MDSQGPSTSVAFAACAAKSASYWTTHMLFHAAGKLYRHQISSYAHDEPVIRFQPTFQARVSLAHGRKEQEARLANLDDDYDMVNWGGDVDKNAEAEYDDLGDVLDEQPRLVVPGLILTTPEGDTVAGDDIPEGRMCLHPAEHYVVEKQWVEKQWLKNIENNLVPGRWKHIRDRQRAGRERRRRMAEVKGHMRQVRERYHGSQKEQLLLREEEERRLGEETWRREEEWRAQHARTAALIDELVHQNDKLARKLELMKEDMRTRQVVVREDFERQAGIASGHGF
ncbi:hypothetical protein LX32DRAFT_646133 [Colletotrichum zoysiae]|uniref:Uncharacterized protein n=1 Tax=Colletotrichum zoysiae TaxID=1216348 RepID=A0AAD9H5C4_9PEZI|nr:hypothetical protein LX32DRAFT_646133 [Colletotrichum zoysiae]